MEKRGDWLQSFIDAFNSKNSHSCKKTQVDSSSTKHLCSNNTAFAVCDDKCDTHEKNAKPLKISASSKQYYNAALSSCSSKSKSSCSICVSKKGAKCSSSKSIGHNSKKTENRKNKNKAAKNRTDSLQLSKNTAKLPQKEEAAIHIPCLIVDLSHPKKVQIRIGNEQFNSFDKAKKHLLTFPPCCERRERLNELREYSEERLISYWKDKFEETLSCGEISMSDLVAEMCRSSSNKLDERKAKIILDKCNNLFDVRKKDGIELYSLKSEHFANKRSPLTYDSPDMEDDCQGFKEEYQRLLEKYPLRCSSDENEEDVYVGLDFGISFTKCAYHYTPEDSGVFTFGCSPFKASVVYLHDDRLSFFKPEGECRQVQYFKATMSKDGNRFKELKDFAFPQEFENSRIGLEFEFLCSVFFIANIIRFVRCKLNDLFFFSPAILVSMGVPVLDTEKGGEIYNRALHAGLFVSGKIDDPSNISLEKLLCLSQLADESFKNESYSYKPYRNEHCTIPELFTEAYYFIHRSNYPAGFYYVIDIGGGTADFIVIAKENAQIWTKENESFFYYCPFADVEDLGNEIRKLNDKTYDTQMKYLNKFKTVYSRVATGFKTRYGLNGCFSLKQIWLGGGAIDKDRFFQKRMSFFRESVKSISCCVEELQGEMNVDVPSIKALGLSSAESQRLIIATQLADPEIVEINLKGLPKDYSKLDRSIPIVRSVEDNNPGYDSIG